MIWQPGVLLQSGKYQVEEQIGRGGFGLTYLAEDCALRRQVVIKTPNRALRSDQDYEKFVARFQHEGRALVQISHPNVVRVVEFFFVEGMPCLVMEYVAGETLNDYIRRRGYMPEREALQYFRKLAETLQVVHQAGLIHCDVHPGNIILRDRYNGTNDREINALKEPVLIDFGAAKSLQPSTLTVTTALNKTFAPYEQGRSPNHQPTLDVHSLAATLYFVVTGEKPVPAIDRKLDGSTLKAPKTLKPELTDRLNQAILRGMALEAEDRPQSMDAWIGLLDVPRPKPKLKRPQPPSPPPPSSERRYIAIREPVRQQSRPSFPWVSLSFVCLGYLSVGAIIALGTNSSAWVWIWVWAVTGVWAWIVAVAVVVAVVVAVAVAVAVGGGGGGAFLVLALILAIAWTWAMAGAGAWAMAGAGALAVAMAVTGLWALALALALALAWTWAGAEEEVWWFVLSLIGALLGGAIAGQSTSVGVWWGLGIGFITFLQWLAVIKGMANAHNSLDERYQPKMIFLIFGLVSTLGLLMGGGIGWGLRLAGVVLK